MTILKPLPGNVFAISGSQVNFTCIFVGDNGQPPARVKFQRKKVRLDFIDEWLEIPDTQRVFQTNITEGETRHGNTLLTLGCRGEGRRRKGWPNGLVLCPPHLEL